MSIEKKPLHPGPAKNLAGKPSAPRQNSRPVSGAKDAFFAHPKPHIRKNVEWDRGDSDDVETRASGYDSHAWEQMPDYLSEKAGEAVAKQGKDRPV